jgi:hypothetical protein
LQALLNTQLLNLAVAVLFEAIRCCVSPVFSVVSHPLKLATMLDAQIFLILNA